MPLPHEAHDRVKNGATAGRGGSARTDSGAVDGMAVTLRGNGLLSSSGQATPAATGHPRKFSTSILLNHVTCVRINATGKAASPRS